MLKLSFKGTVLFDFNITQGGTVNELRNYIENNGGRVVDVFSLTASQGSTILKPSEKQLDELRKRYGEELGQLLEDGDIAADPGAITASEAAYILKLSLDTFRSRVAEARQERDGRILQEALGHRLSVEAANVANARLKSQQILDDIKGTVLGNAINKDFKETSTANLIGQTITSPADLAALAQIYRNPSFETFRYFFVKNGEVVWQTGVTARLPNYSPARHPEN